MTFINDFVGQWFPMIDKPIYVNGKQGFLLTNGFRIFFKQYNLSNTNKGILKRHLKETLINYCVSHNLLQNMIPAEPARKPTET